MDESSHDINDKFMSSMKSSISSNLGEYVVLNPLNRGADGFVFHIRHRRNKKEYALKVIWKGTTRKNLDSKTRNEMAIHWELKHPNVLRLQNKFEDFDNYYMVLDYCSEGDLQKHRSVQGSFTEEQTRSYGMQVARAIEYLHDRHIVHRDLKPQNILVTAEHCVKVCDFGYSVTTKDRLKDVIGTLNYFAPEIVQRDYDNKVDVWAFGCILYFMATGQTPFHCSSISDVIERVKGANVQYPEGMYPELKNLLKAIFVNDPKCRPTIKQVIEHRFFTQQPPTQVAADIPLEASMKRVSSSRLIPTLPSVQSAVIDDKPTVRRRQMEATCHTTTNVTQQANNENVCTLNRPSSTGRNSKPKESRINNFIKQHQTKPSNELTKELLNNELRLRLRTKEEDAHLSPFVTKGLKPTKMDTAHGFIFIDGNGFTNETKESQTKFNVSPLGKTVRIQRKGVERTYPLTKLPAKYRAMYNYCKEVVSIVKNNTTRVKIEDSRGRFSLMWTGRFIAELSCDKRIEMNRCSPPRTNDTPERSIAKRYFRAINDLLD